MISNSVAKVTNIEANKWQMCSVDNATFVECPINDEFEGTFVLTSYNPSTVSQSIQRIKVPPANYTVQVFDQRIGNWTYVHTNLICSDYEINEQNTQKYVTCTLYINATSTANAKTYFKVTKQEFNEEFSNKSKNQQCIQSS